MSARYSEANEKRTVCENQFKIAEYSELTSKNFKVIDHCRGPFPLLEDASSSFVQSEASAEVDWQDTLGTERRSFAQSVMLLHESTMILDDRRSMIIAQDCPRIPSIRT